MSSKLALMLLTYYFVLGDNGRIKYSITSGDERSDFLIAPNGSITTRRILDREVQSLYNLVVTATDQAVTPNKKLSSTVQVNIIRFQYE